MSQIKLKKTNTPTTNNEELGKMLEVYDAYDKIQESEKPFYTVKDDTVAVVGNANDTEVSKIDFKIKFLFEADELEEVPSDAEIIGRYVVVEEMYEKVQINPKRFPRLIEHALEIQPFITAVEDLIEESKENPEAKEEYGFKLNRIYSETRDETIDACYNLVRDMLGIEPEMAEHMQPYSVLEAVIKIIAGNPDLFNSANVLFG